MYYCLSSMQIMLFFIFLYYKGLTRPITNHKYCRMLKKDYSLFPFHQSSGMNPKSGLCRSHVSMIRKIENPARSGKGKEWRKVKLWSATIDYGDGRGEEIHFLWVSRPPRSEWMNTTLRNPFMLQEGSFSLPPLCLLGDGREWRKKSNRVRRRRRRERGGGGGGGGEGKRPLILPGSSL